MDHKGGPKNKRSGPAVYLQQLRDPAFWAEAWQEANARRRRKRRTLQENIALWNRRAGRFKRRRSSTSVQKRVQSTLRFLKEHGANWDGARVLDIGAGPGNYTFAFAQDAAEVVALEPAEEMLAIMRETAAREGYTNIELLPATWEVADPAREPLRGGFDLVFASMTPGINGRETIEKALSCTNGYLFVSSFAGKRHNDALAALWPLLFNEAPPSRTGDIIFLFNYLYAQGYPLFFETWEEQWVIETTASEATNELLFTLETYGKEPQPLTEAISAFVRSRTVEGVFRQVTTSRLGRLLVAR